MRERARIARDARLGRAAALCIGLFGVPASPAAAATVTEDTDSPAPLPGELRYEIINAPPGDTVTIANGVDPVLEEGEILIDKNLVVAGQGANQTSIFPPNPQRIFKIGSVTPAAVVTIRDLKLTGGHAPNGANGVGAGDNGDPGGAGGAILTNAVLTLNRVFMFSNSAGNGGLGTTGANGNPNGSPGGLGGPGGQGGAVLNQVGGNLTVTNSTFYFNHGGDGGAGGNGGNTTAMFGGAGAGGAGGAGQDGGAISNAGAMTVTNSTFVWNDTGKGGTGGDRGTGLGGAGGTGGTGGDGGAIHQAGAGSLTITNSTIANNTADIGGAGGMGFSGPASSGTDGSGGGTYFFIGVTLAGTLYSQNTATTGSNCAGGGTISQTSPNLSFPAGGCPASFSTGNPQLGTLMFNGGPTQTMALGAGSAAINQVPVGSPNCPGADQRGIARPQGPTCDIGAFELEMVPATPAPPSAGASPAGGSPVPTQRKCKKGRKLNKKGKCVKRKRRR
jgi:hypothetical protein